MKNWRKILIIPVGVIVMLLMMFFAAATVGIGAFWNTAMNWAAKEK